MKQQLQNTNTKHSSALCTTCHCRRYPKHRATCATGWHKHNFTTPISTVNTFTSNNNSNCTQKEQSLQVLRMDLMFMWPCIA